MKQKNIIVVLSVVTVCVLAGIIAVYAYLFSVPEELRNEIIIGYNDIEIQEEFEPPTEQTSVTYYKKKVTVKNTGDTPCFVRVFVDFSSVEIRNLSALSYDEADEQDPSLKTYYSAVPDMTVGHFIKEVSSENNPNKGWVYIKEDDFENGSIGGYYYYTEPLEPGNETPPLFTYVKTDYTGSTTAAQQYDVIVYSESVQIVTSNGKSAAGEGEQNHYITVWKEFTQV